MGARSMNFHREVPVRMGYEAEARKIQELYMDGKKDEAAAAVPDEARRAARAHRPRRQDPPRPRGRGAIRASLRCSSNQGPPERLRQAAELVLG
jgi:hypothetical protein